MLRNALILIVVSLSLALGVLAADHNAGLKIAGSLTGWSVENRPFVMSLSTPETRYYIAMLEFVVTNDGTDVIICPYLGSELTEVKFIKKDADLVSEIVKPFNLFWRRYRSNSFEEPPVSDYRILEPGDSFRFGMKYPIILEPKVPDEKRWEAEDRKFYESRFVEAPETARRQLESTYLQFVFRIVPHKGENDVMPTLAARWRKYGILPLNDSGEFVIETDVFKSNTDWIKPEDLP